MKRWIKNINTRFPLALWWWTNSDENLFHLDPDALCNFSLMVAEIEKQSPGVAATSWQVVEFLEKEDCYA